MSPTELRLLAIHKALAIPLGSVAKTYLGISLGQARRHASKNTLPFPAFKPDDTNPKSPWMVSVAALAEFLDGLASQAEKSWTKSKV